MATTFKIDASLDAVMQEWYSVTYKDGQFYSVEIAE